MAQQDCKSGKVYSDYLKFCVNTPRPCAKGYQRPNGDAGRLCESEKNSLSSENVPITFIAGAWISENNPVAVASILANKGLVASFDIAKKLTSTEKTQLLYNYYLQNGIFAYQELLRSIPVIENGKGVNDLAQALPEISNITGIPINTTNESGLPTTSGLRTTSVAIQDIGKFASNLFNGLIGQTSSTTTITGGGGTTTKASPVIIGVILGGLLLIGIMAYVLFFRKTA